MGASTPNLKPGCSLVGLGSGVVVKLATNSSHHGSKFYGIIGESNNVIQNITVDMSADVLCATAGKATGSALYARGGNSLIENCTVRNIRADGNGLLESFPISAGPLDSSVFVGKTTLRNNRLIGVLPDLIQDGGWVSQSNSAYVSAFTIHSPVAGAGVSIIEGNILDSEGAGVWTATGMAGYNGVVRNNIAMSPVSNGYYMDSWGCTNILVENNRFKCHIGFYFVPQDFRWSDIQFVKNCIEWRPSGNWPGGGWVSLATIAQWANQTTFFGNIKIENNVVTYSDAGTDSYPRYGIGAGASGGSGYLTGSNWVFRGNSLPRFTTNSIANWLSVSVSITNNFKDDGGIVTTVYP